MVRFRLEVGFATDVGRQRKRNEDSYVVYLPSGDDDPSDLLGLLLVADGMGGERAGDRASQTAAERIREWMSTAAWKTWPIDGGPPIPAALGMAVRRVSDEIFQIGEDDPAVRGLGSTLVAVALEQDRMTVAHVGDSRCYRIRGSSIEQLTADHSWVERQVQAGFLTPEQARSHPQRNVLTRSLGDESTPEVDVRSEPLQPGDLFLLCSDGLTGGVTDAELLAEARRHDDPQELADALVNLANEKDGSDNITAVVGLCEAVDGGAAWTSDSEDTRPLTPYRG